METTANSYFLPVGATLENGKYRILEVLGHGGFGVTYLAEHRSFGKVALKELFLNSGAIQCSRENVTQRKVVAHFDDARFEGFKKRFEDEARTLRSLQDIEGVVKVLDVFEENSTVYFSMEYLDGEKLTDYIARRSKLSREERLGLVFSIGKILSEIHSRGVLHRDVKPDNIIITKTDRLSLIDFGIAKSQVQDPGEMHTTIHTPLYSPPEQKVANQKMGFYSDVYSLGATAYYIFTGRQPQSIDERITTDYRPPVYYAPSLPENINQAVNRSLTLVPEQRLQTVEEFLEALKVKIPLDETRILTPPPQPVTANLRPIAKAEEVTAIYAPATDAAPEKTSIENQEDLSEKTILDPDRPEDSKVNKNTPAFNKNTPTVNKNTLAFNKLSPKLKAGVLAAASLALIAGIFIFFPKQNAYLAPAAKQNLIIAAPVFAPIQEPALVNKDTNVQTTVKTVQPGLPVPVRSRSKKAKTESVVPQDQPVAKRSTEQMEGLPEKALTKVAICPNDGKYINVEIYNLEAKLMEKSALNGRKEIDVGYLAKGNYTLKCVRGDEILCTKKFQIMQ